MNDGSSPRRIGSGQRLGAVRRLLGPDAAAGSAEVFLDQLTRDGTELEHFWGLPGPAGGWSQVLLIVPSAGGAAMCYLSPATGEGPASDGDPSARAGLIRAAIADFRARVPAGRVAQALFEPAALDVEAAYAGAGFTRLAELAYMKRELPKRRGAQADTPAWPEGVRVEPLSEMPAAQGRRLLLAALQRSYTDTLDCPALCAMRSPEEALASHTAVGQHDPSLWHLVSLHSEPEGCLLLSSIPQHRTMELVYLGLSPALRGRGLGRALVWMALTLLGGRPERTIACAVDTSNTPAMRLYRGAGFYEFASRTAMVLPLRGGH